MSDGVCAECGGGIPYGHARKTTASYCSAKCRYKARDRARYERDPEAVRARSRAYYAANRELVLGKAAARRAGQPAERRACSECGELLEGRRRLVCSSRCRDRRYARLHPEALAEKLRRKRARRRARAQGAGGA